MKTPGGSLRNQRGFSAVEFMVAAVVFGILSIGITNAYISLRRSYTIARQLNELYTVLSACPEVDRALEFNVLSSTNNCYPNNTFAAEDGTGGTVSYAPSLTVTDTAALPSTDPLRMIPDSKVLNITAALPAAPNGAKPYQLRMLITRNGVGQQ